MKNLEVYNNFVKSVVETLERVSRYLEACEGTLKFTNTRKALEPSYKKALMAHINVAFNVGNKEAKIEIQTEKNASKVWVYIVFQGTREGFIKRVKIWDSFGDWLNKKELERLLRIDYTLKEVTKTEVIFAENNYQVLSEKKKELARQLEETEKELARVLWVADKFLDKDLEEEIIE